MNATHRWNIKTGATRSGKTYMDYFVIPKRIMNTTGNGHIVLIGHTLGTVQKNIIEPMQRIWGRGLVSDISTTTGRVKIFGKRCYALGADNRARVSSLQGDTIEYCYGDEITTWEQSVFDMLKSRLSTPTSVFDGTCNPDGPKHWFKAFLDNEAGADIYHQQFTIYDNPALPERFVRELEKEYSGTVYYDRFILGKWTLAEGLVYRGFSQEKHVYDDLPDEIRERCIKYVAIDYGTANPCVFLSILYDPEENITYVDREYYYDGRNALIQKTDADYAEDLLEFSPPADTSRVIIDPSALSFRVLIRREHHYKVVEANNDVKNGIRQVASMLGLEKLKVRSSCKNTIQEFLMYAWDDKAAKLGEERVLKVNDHAMDALRYFCYTVVKMKKVLNSGGE